jgi:tyrosine-specific transport protein
MMNKFLGGILLIVGTTIGGGMLALPVVTAQLGFVKALFFLLMCWAIMTASAFLLLEANLWQPINNNLPTMAKTTLGRWGQLLTWLSYLLLLYSLLAAYMAGGGDFLQHLLLGLRLKFSNHFSTYLFTFALSIVVYHGIHSVDFFNRGFMLSKLFVIGLLILCISPFVSLHLLFAPQKFQNFSSLLNGITVIITSFGFAIIIPSLRSYFESDIKTLRKVIFIGSFIPLVCYILWDLVVMGAIPLRGQFGLRAMNDSSHPTSDLIHALNLVLNNPAINLLAKVFASICLATSFLGVALSLFDFLSDGLAIKKTGAKKLILYIATFIPPLLIANHYPRAFIEALSYAGVLCALLLILLPVLMVWSGRYKKKYAADFHVLGGKPLLIGLFIIALALIIVPLIFKN